MKRFSEHLDILPTIIVWSRLHTLALTRRMVGPDYAQKQIPAVNYDMARKLSPKQKAHRKYLASAEWKAKRARYWASKLPKECYVCRKINLPMDLHHRTYERFENERLTDLVPVHRKCHKKIHRYHNKNRHLSLWDATAEVRRLTKP